MRLAAFFSIVDIHKKVLGGAAHATDLIHQAHAHLARHEPRLQAFRAIGAPPSTVQKGLLSGVSVSVKDLYGVTGFDTFAGSPLALS